MSRLRPGWHTGAIRGFRRGVGRDTTMWSGHDLTGGETWQDTPVLLLPYSQPARAAATLSMAKLHDASIRRRHPGDPCPLRPRLTLELEPDMDEQRRDHHRAADDGAPGRHLGMDEPDPYRPKDRFECAEQCRDGRRDQPRTGGEEGEANAEI